VIDIEAIKQRLAAAKGECCSSELVEHAEADVEALVMEVERLRALAGMLTSAGGVAVEAWDAAVNAKKLSPSGTLCGALARAIDALDLGCNEADRRLRDE